MNVAEDKYCIAMTASVRKSLCKTLYEQNTWKTLATELKFTDSHIEVNCGDYK